MAGSKGSTLSDMARPTRLGVPASKSSVFLDVFVESLTSDVEAVAPKASRLCSPLGFDGDGYPYSRELGP